VCNTVQNNVSLYQSTAYVLTYSKVNSEIIGKYMFISFRPFCNLLRVTYSNKINKLEERKIT